MQLTRFVVAQLQLTRFVFSHIYIYIPGRFAFGHMQLTRCVICNAMSCQALKSYACYDTRCIYSKPCTCAADTLCPRTFIFQAISATSLVALRCMALSSCRLKAETKLFLVHIHPQPPTFLFVCVLFDFQGEGDGKKRTRICAMI